MKLAPAIFANHGGGPMPILGDPGHADLTQTLKSMQPWVNELKAIILVTAHWETTEVSITGQEKPGLLYDYYNFPPEAYKLKYPGKGSPTIANELKTKLQNAGFKANLDTKRDWDHGVYIPMMLLRPQADIPIVQVSVLASQDPAELLKYGKVLAEFRKDGVGIIGSGMSYHKMAGFFAPNPAGNLEFEKELNNALVDPKRKERFVKWRSWLGANDCHPLSKAEHFSPLVVIVGSSSDTDDVTIKNTRAMSAAVTTVKFE